MHLETWEPHLCSESMKEWEKRRLACWSLTETAKARISHAFPLHTAMAVDKGSILTCGGDCELVDEGERPGRTAESADDCEAERSRLMGMGVDGVGLDDMGDWCGLKVRC
jgi:hypothetical protein